ncbi:MAG: hypothetical protein KAU44_02765 [Candidatus Marinimicrobia bacterium]|nr:hypothetical protein [Candidatus Neomarinimicrobiota bacterium]
MSKINMDTENINISMVSLSQVDSNLKSLLLIHYATEKVIDEYLDLTYHDKDELKEIGANTYRYKDRMTEFYILGLSKTIEDLLWLLKDINNLKLRFWRDLSDLQYFKYAKLIRYLSNVIKHHGGMIVEESCSDARSLITDYGFHDYQSVTDWDNNDKFPFRFPLYVFYIQQFCYHVINNFVSHAFPVPIIPDIKGEDFISNHLLSDFMEILGKNRMQNTPT